MCGERTHSKEQGSCFIRRKAAPGFIPPNTLNASLSIYLLSHYKQPFLVKLFKVRQPYFCSQIIGCVPLIFKGMEQFITNVNNLQQMFSALISVLLKQNVFLICIIPLMSYEKSEDLLLHCLMDKSTLILVIYNMKNKYLCFSLLGICQALTLNISSKQSNEKLTIGPNCSPLEFAFDLVSVNFGVDGACSLSLHHMLGGSKPPNFTKFQITQFYCTKN